jgi:hypothetical protein
VKDAVAHLHRNTRALKKARFLNNAGKKGILRAWPIAFTYCHQ